MNETKIKTTTNGTAIQIDTKQNIHPLELAIKHIEA